LFAGGCSNAYAGIYADVTTRKNANTNLHIKTNGRTLKKQEKK